MKNVIIGIRMLIIIFINVFLSKKIFENTVNAMPINIGPSNACDESVRFI